MESTDPETCCEKLRTGYMSEKPIDEKLACTILKKYIKKSPNMRFISGIYEGYYCTCYPDANSCVKIAVFERKMCEFLVAKGGNETESKQSYKYQCKEIVDEGNPALLSTKGLHSIHSLKKEFSKAVNDSVFIEPNAKIPENFTNNSLLKTKFCKGVHYKMVCKSARIYNKYDGIKAAVRKSFAVKLALEPNTFFPIVILVCISLVLL
ncbi:hypothetical protein BB560_005065 [Smittium megazygosporum]|uniref:Uncharacterized protein n=1 Tax=Smittium megazygosporum TaxID=133381 RepID=A0A2T9Z7J0_9FUNG|nr:hypothetical protein BB560_005065 [Smittium megazygosporum]